MARIRQPHAAGVRGAVGEFAGDEHGRQGEQKDEHAPGDHRISLQPRSAAAAAKAAARKNAERNARVIVS